MLHERHSVKAEGLKLLPISARAKCVAEIAHKFYQPHSLRALYPNGPGPMNARLEESRLAVIPIGLPVGVSSVL
jgi:hypothetical protein